MFDGRVAEDLKLASGAWVSVGPLRAGLFAALAPIAQEVNADMPPPTVIIV